MLPTTVTVAKAIYPWVKDASGAMQPAYGPASAPIACSVQQASTRDTVVHAKEGSENFFSVFFPSDPIVKPRDLLTWVDGGNLSLIAQGPAINEAGQSAVWKVVCEYRPVS